jgi:transposase-like protein
MFFMDLLYLAIILGTIWILWKKIFEPMVIAQEEAAAETESARIAKKAELAGEQIADLDERIELLEELSTQLQTLRQTKQVAERVAAVKLSIKLIQEEIANADVIAVTADTSVEKPVCPDCGAFLEGIKLYTMRCPECGKEYHPPFERKAEEQCCGDPNCKCHEDGPAEKAETNPVEPAEKPVDGKPVKVAKAKPKE